MIRFGDHAAIFVSPESWKKSSRLSSIRRCRISNRNDEYLK